MFMWCICFDYTGTANQAYQKADLYSFCAVWSLVQSYRIFVLTSEQSERDTLSRSSMENAMSMCISESAVALSI